MTENVLKRVPFGGGQPQTLATLNAKSGEDYVVPQLLPGGREVLIFGGGAPRIVALNLQTGEQKILIEQAGTAQYLPSEADPAKGHILYDARPTDSLIAVPFDVDRLEVKGSPVPVVDGVKNANAPFLGALGISESGTLAYVPGKRADTSGCN